MKLIIPNFWRTRTIFSYLLIPFSWVYQYISKKKQFVPKTQIYKSSAKIITIGNVTVGGGGKTPIAHSIAKILYNYTQSKYAILTKGYKGKLNGPILVTSEHSLDEVGDEALLLSKDFVTCVAKDRLEGIKFLEEQGYEYIITDDGLHDLRFKKALTFMVVDTDFGFGNELIIPAGPLRENIKTAIEKTNIVILIGGGVIDYKFPTNKIILKADIVSKTHLKNKKYIAFAGIGNPQKFFKSVREAEGEVIKEIAFPDHHPYTDKDMRKLLELKQSMQAELITTEKDYTRLSDEYKSQVNVLPINIVWREENTILSKILSL